MVERIVVREFAWQQPFPSTLRIRGEMYMRGILF